MRSRKKKPGPPAPKPWRARIIRILNCARCTKRTRTLIYARALQGICRKCARAVIDERQMKIV